MKFWFVTSLFLLIAASSLNVTAQQKPVLTDLERSSVQGTLDEQKTEIESLRQELKKEAELRRQQGVLIEKLLHKMEELDAHAAKTSSVMIASAAPAANQDKAQTSLPTGTGDKLDTARGPQAKTANAVEAGFGKIKFSGLLQGWYSAGNRGINDTFRIRRAELKFSGDLLPKVKWTVMLDPAKALSVNTTTTTIDGVPVVRAVSVNQASRIFQEAFITLSYLKRANVNIGQFKVPLSQEALQSSAALDTVERALFLSDRSRGGGLGDSRDIGVMAFGPLNDQLDYQIGVFNGVGESQNDVDTNERKAVIGRLVYRPSFIKGLQIGGSGAFGNGARTDNPRHDRLGAELVYQRDKLKIKGELMTGVDGDIHRRGYYAHVGYRFLPKVEGIFRYDVFDPDIRRETAALNVGETDYIGGINYYIKDNNFKLQLNYLRKTFADRITQSRNVFAVNLQTAW